MIHYQYRHEGNEYRVRFSVDRSDRNYEYYESIFEKMRKSFGVNGFTYATLGSGERILMQSTENSEGANQFVQGLLFDADQLSAAPSKYIGKMDKQPSLRDAEADVLSDGKFPETGRLAADFSITRNLKHIFGKLADALVYGKKDERIIIIAESRESAENYIKALGLFLPVSYMNNVGFSVGCTNLPSRSISVVKDNGETVTAGVRIIAPETGVLDYGSCASSGYTFDTRTMRNNYGAKLSTFGEAVDELDLGSSPAVNAFVNRIKRAFSYDGSVDLDLLERLATLYLFETRYGDYNLARRVLKLDYCDAEQDVALIEAINAVFDRAATNGVSAEDIALARRAMGYSETIYFAVCDKFCDYLIDNFAMLNDDEKNSLIEILAGETDCNKIDRLILKAQTGDIYTVKAAFSIMGEVFKKAFNDSNGDISVNAELIKRMVDFVNVNNFRRAGNEVANIFFEVVANSYGSAIGRYLTAILMASAYSSGAIASGCELRFRGLKQMLQNRKLSAVDELVFINAVCEILIEMSGKLPELNLDSDLDSEFIYNISTGKIWLDEHIEKISLAQTLKLEAHMYGSDYCFVRLLRSLRAKLLDLNYVNDNIKSGHEELIDGYLSFFDHLPTNERQMAVTIKAYLEQLSNEKKVSAEFVRFRSDFMYGYFNTLSEEDRRKIVRGRTAQEAFYSDSMPTRTEAVEETVKTFRKPVGSSKKTFKKPKGIILWAVMFGLVSVLLLFVPPVIISASVGDFVQRFLNFFEPWYVLIPVYTFTVCIVSYLLCKKGDRIAVAAKMTSLLGVLPVACYVLSYMLFYFIRVSLIF